MIRSSKTDRFARISDNEQDERVRLLSMSNSRERSANPTTVASSAACFAINFPDASQAPSDVTQQNQE